jgi:hypothetical protein
MSAIESRRNNPGDFFKWTSQPDRFYQKNKRNTSGRRGSEDISDKAALTGVQARISPKKN